MKDNISDMLTRIRNGQKAFLDEIPLFWPTPKFCLQILTVLQQKGFIRGIRKKPHILNQTQIFVLLKYTSNQNPVISKIDRISCPGKRIFCKSVNLWKINNGRGTFIISSPQGLITENEARLLNVGGEVILYIE